MNTRIQIGIDKTFGSFLNILLYGIVRLLGKILRINHDLNRPFHRIVVCKLKGMGSIVQASALLATLRKNYPTAEIIFVSTEANKSILNFYSDSINGTILIQDNSIFKLINSSISALWKLWKFRPQLYIDIEVYSNYSSLLCTLSAASNRFGYYKSDKNYRSGLYTHLMYYNIKAPLSEIYLQMARILPIKEVDQELIPLILSDEIQSNSIQKLREFNPQIEPFNYLVINPNASDLRLERRWPAEYFIQLIQEIRVLKPEMFLVLIGNKQEAKYVNEIAKHFQQVNRVIDSSGKLKLDELIAVMNNANGIITNDTGPLHLALALRKKTVGLFGPCAPDQYGQMQTCIPVYTNVYCSPCVHEFINPPCAGDNQCMKQMNVSMVIKAWKKLMEEQADNYVNSHIAFESNSTPMGFIHNRK
jgi:ADP-heptose:LPS heptosyltransferase